MSDKWRGLDRHITAELAEAEPEASRLFGPSYDRRQQRLRGELGGINRASYQPWRKPKIERSAREQVTRQ